MLKLREDLCGTTQGGLLEVILHGLNFQIRQEKGSAWEGLD